MSLFTSFNTGVSGLHASQSGLNTTAHNLANTRTQGYTRQQNINTDKYYRTIKVTTDGALKIGYGTAVSQVRQIRDIFLDKEYRVGIGCQSFYEKLAETQSEIEDVLGELEGVAFQNSLTDLWEVVETISTNPESIVNRELFISKAEAFLETAQNVYSALSTYQTSLNKEISEQVDDINDIAEKIAYYNIAIAKTEAAGVENANDYRDIRNQWMDELAKYTNYNYTEDSDGTVQIYVNNAPLVIEGISYHMECEKIQFTEYNAVTGKNEVVAGSPMYKVVWSDNGYGDVYNLDKAYSSAGNTDIGSLLGILTVRGNKVANYSDIPVAPEEEEFYTGGVLDQTAYKIAVNKFNADLKTYNNTTSNSIITKIQAQFDLLIHGVINMINDAFCPNIETNLNAVSGRDESGNAVTLNGSYRVLDVLNCPVGTDDAETMGTEMFSRNEIPRYQIVTLNAQIYTKDADGNNIGLAKDNGDGTFSLFVYNEEDTTDIDTMYTLQNMAINPALTEDYALMPVMANPALGEYGSYDMKLFNNLLKEWTKEFAVLDPNKLTTYSFNSYYVAMVGDLGTQGNIWQSKVEKQTSLVESVENKRQQVAGVSTDEELTSLLLYQHAYNAASRYITTIDSMLQHLIERLG